MVFFLEFAHFAVTILSVTLRRHMLLTLVMIVGPDLDSRFCGFQLPTQTRMILMDEQACAISWFDITAQHLQNLCCATQWASIDRLADS